MPLVWRQLDNVAWDKGLGSPVADIFKNYPALDRHNYHIFRNVVLGDGFPRWDHQMGNGLVGCLDDIFRQVNVRCCVNELH